MMSLRKMCQPILTTSKNIARDVKEKRELEEAGWKAIVLWECEISTKKKREIRLPALEDEIKSQL